MEENLTTPVSHLVSPDRIAASKSALPTLDLTRRRGQGNGLRMHTILFAAMSVAVLAGFMVLISTAGTRM